MDVRASTATATLLETHVQIWDTPPLPFLKIFHVKYFDPLDRRGGRVAEAVSCVCAPAHHIPYTPYI